MSRDEYYATRAARIDTLIGDSTYFALLARLSDEYKRLFRQPSISWEGFFDWCEREHGFRPTANSDGFRGDPKITDDKKYTLCLLKYSG